MQIGGGETLDPAKRAKLQESALNYARCMREHGVDMPDPKLSGDGGLTFQAGPGPRAATAGPGGSGSTPSRRSSRPPTRRATTSWATAPAAARARRRRSERRRPPRCARPRSAAAAAAPCWRRRASPPAAVAWLLLAPGDGDGTGPPTMPCRSAPPRSSAATSSTARTSTARSASPTPTQGDRPGRRARSPACATRATTVTRGRSLMSIDAKATAWVLYGTIPMYRDLGPGVADGRDVRQLERNLDGARLRPRHGRRRLDLGDDRRGRATSRTTAASPRTARSRAREVVVSDGPARVGKHSAEVGDPARAGAPVTELTTTTPVVTAKLDAGLAADVASRRRGPRRPARRHRGRRPRRPSVGTVATAGRERRVADGRAARRPDRGRHGAPRRGAGERVARDRAHEGRARGAGHRAGRDGARRRYAVELAGSRRLVARDPRRCSPTAGSQVTGAGLARRARGWWCRDDASSCATSTKEYAGGVRALDGVSLTVADGELVAVVGPSGSGSPRCCTSWARSIGRSGGRVRVAGATSPASTTASSRRCARTGSASSSSSSSCSTG